MENATKPPIAMDDLRVLAKKMKVGMTVHLFFRKKHHSDVASVYKSATYRVDVSMPAIISDASVDEYAWLSPEERPDDSEPFPEDGLHGCDLYEYSYVDISGEPDPDPVDSKSRRCRPSQRGSTDRSSKSGDREPEVRLRAGSREVAEDCSMWSEVLCTDNEALNAVNLESMMSYFKTTFGGLGAGNADLKKSIAVTLKSLGDDMEAVMSAPSLAKNKSWVRARHRFISELDGYRSASMGFSQTLVRETKLAYEGETIEN